MLTVHASTDGLLLSDSNRSIVIVVSMKGAINYCDQNARTLRLQNTKHTYKIPS